MHGKTVLITGASSGIGEALARELGLQGANLVLAARRLERLEKLAAELRTLGARVLPIDCDVTRDGDPEKAVQAAIREFGTLDVVIANAGFGVSGNLEKLTIDDYRRQFETNVFGVLRTIYAALPELKRSRGSIAILGSIMGYATLPGTSPYSMSKHAIRSLSQALSMELEPHGISVTHIAPGYVQSEIQQVDNKGVFHPVVRSGPPKSLVIPAAKAAHQIARAIVRRRRERIITVHGRLAVWATRFTPSLFWLLRRFISS